MGSIKFNFEDGEKRLEEVLLVLIGTYVRFHKLRALYKVVLAVRKCQPCLYLLKVRHVCAIMKLSLEIEYIISLPYFAAPAWGGRIYRPCPYCIHRALFLQPRFALLTWLCLRVTVLDERREGFLFFFLFLYYSPHPSAAAQRVFAHELGKSSTMPCCICKRCR